MQNDPSPLLCIHKTTNVVLCPVWGSELQKKCWQSRENLEEKK